jgi:hypothetical protein
MAKKQKKELKKETIATDTTLTGKVAACNLELKAVLDKHGLELCGQLKVTADSIVAHPALRLKK